MRLTLLMFTVALAASAAAAVHAGPAAGASAPDFVLKSVAGSNVRLSEHRSEVVMLAFTSSRCSACRAWDANLAEVHRRYRDAGLVLLVVSLDRNPRDAESVASRLGADFPVLVDTRGETGKLFDIDDLPTLVLIDRTGVVRHVLDGDSRAGEREPEERVVALLREL
jgi:peroxiredoxin